MTDAVLWFNPACSKCRRAKQLLAEQGVACDLYEYLREGPSRIEIERVLGMLGTDDPRAMMRTGDPLYAELALAKADRAALLEAMVSHPALIERPILLRDGRAVIARPPEKIRELL